MDIIKNINIITCTNDTLLKNYYISFKDDKISEIGSMTEFSEISEGTVNIIDGGNRYLMPGLINCHEHILCDHEHLSTDVMSYEHTLMKGTLISKALLNAGFTTVRSMVDFHNLEMTFRDAIKNNVIEGPDLYVTGIGMTATGGHFGNILYCCDTVALAETYTKKQIALGADFIKVYLTGGVTTVGTADDINVSPEVLHKIVEIAHGAGKQVAVHCIGSRGVEVAAQAGVDSIEHGSGMSAEAARTMIEKNITLVPTILPGYMNYISPNRSKMPEFLLEKSDQYMVDCQNAAKLAREVGLKIAMGTDGGAINTPHDKGAMELQLLHEVGYTKQECLKIATVNGADLLGLKDRGTIEIGKRADCIIIDGNPLEDLKFLEEIALVFKAGKLISQ